MSRLPIFVPPKEHKHDGVQPSHRATVLLLAVQCLPGKLDPPQNLVSLRALLFLRHEMLVQEKLAVSSSRCISLLPQRLLRKRLHLSARPLPSGFEGIERRCSRAGCGFTRLNLIQLSVNIVSVQSEEEVPQPRMVSEFSPKQRLTFLQEMSHH